MGHLLQKRLRLPALTVRGRLRQLCLAGALVTLALAAPAQAARHADAPVPIRGTSPLATLRQVARVTFLTMPGTPPLRLALTHDSDYPQGFNPPFAASKVGESPGRFLIFTDSFASNPGNVQGECGASESGERYLHVVALGKQPRETFSRLVESCRKNTVLAHPVRWNAAAGTLTIDLIDTGNGPAGITYRVGPAGDVTGNTSP